MNDNQNNGEEMTWKSLNDMITPTYSPSPSPTSTPLGVKRSRISRACDICRRKKTKCDATETRKCKTCIQYGWECTFNDTTKKRGPPKGYIESLENRLKKMENLLEQMQHQDKPELIADEPEEPPRKRREPSIVELPASIEHSKTASYLGSSSGYYLVRDILSTDKEVIEKVDQYPRISSITGVENKGPVAFRKINTTDDDVMIVCDKTLAEHMGQVEADKSRINSDIAPKELLDELVLKFFELNHAVLPVVDKQPFVDAYYGRTQPPPATVLMYAIWAHTCSLLSIDDPLFVKYNVDREQLYDVLWEHTSSILRLEYLTPRYATIQALVLICTYPTTYKTFHRNWIRAGMAVRMAQELGLHRTMEKLPLTKEMTEARKRLWYCVYITDRWSCAVLGRPLAISDADCDIELPDIMHNGNDYTVFVNFVKLSGILGEVLSRIYSPKAKSHGSKSMQTYHTVQSIHFMLNDWLHQLPNHLRIESQDMNAALNYGNIKFEEAGPLMICYHFVLILLYRIFLVANKCEVLPELFDRANECCTTAAKSIVDIARKLSASAIVCFGVNFAGYAIFQASLIHVYNSTSSNPEVARAAKAYVNISIEECIKPLAKTVHCIPKTSLGLIQALMELTGANKDGPKSTNDASNDIANNATITPSTLRPSPPKPQPSPMSMHAIVSDWESNTGSNNTYNNGGLPAMQAPEPFNNNNTTAAWQSLFASAGAPFFENESDWQAMLSSLFDENQMKAINNSFI